MRVLRARLYQRALDERRADESKLVGDKKSIEWGSQIRSYVLHPYRMVKDHRTGHETGDTDKVLDGGLAPFIEAYLRSRADAGRAVGPRKTGDARFRRAAWLDGRGSPAAEGRAPREAAAPSGSCGARRSSCPLRPRSEALDPLYPPDRKRRAPSRADFLPRGAEEAGDENLFATAVRERRRSSRSPPPISSRWAPCRRS
jgi:hypothetical protein